MGKHRYEHKTDGMNDIYPEYEGLDDLQASILADRQLIRARRERLLRDGRYGETVEEFLARTRRNFVPRIPTTFASLGLTIRPMTQEEAGRIGRGLQLMRHSAHFPIYAYIRERDEFASWPYP